MYVRYIRGPVNVSIRLIISKAEVEYKKSVKVKNVFITIHPIGRHMRGPVADHTLNCGRIHKKICSGRQT